MGVIVRFVGIRWIYGGNRWTFAFTGSYNTPYEKIGDEVRSLADYAPFEIPETWEWCRVGDLFTNMSGLAYKKEALDRKSNRMIRVMRGGNIGDERYYFKADDVFISDEFVKPELFLKKNYMITPAVSSLEHIGKIALIEEDLGDTVVGGFVLMLIPLFNDDILSKFLLYALAAKNHRDNCRIITHKSGQAFYNLSRELLMNLPIPLPPRSEMSRIVTKLEEVLPFVDSYCEVERESTALNLSFPDALKKSILQWAVQGKLVPQDPTDEPAEALLERIRGEKERLVREGKIKKDKHESVIFRRDNSHYEKRGKNDECIDEVLPFDIPQSWQWERWGNISLNIQYGYNAPAKESGCTRMVRISDIQNNEVLWNTVPFCEIPKEDIPGYELKPRDILFARTGGTVGKSFLVTGVPFEAVYAGYLIRTQYSLELNAQYMKYFMESPLYWEQLKTGTTATAQPNCNGVTLSKMFIPVPPRDEQERIVAKLNSIIPILEHLAP